MRTARYSSIDNKSVEHQPVSRRQKCNSYVPSVLLIKCTLKDVWLLGFNAVTDKHDNISLSVSD